MMETPRSVILLRIAIALVLLVFWIVFAPRALAQSCPAGSHFFTHTLAGGTTWNMCWAEDSASGITLTDVTYITATNINRRILKEARLGQINVVLDDNSQSWSHVTDGGLGGSLADLDSAQCPGGQLLSGGGRNLICQRTEDRGYAYKYYGQFLQGTQLTLTSLLSLATGDYILRWVFTDDGTIQPEIGHAGDIRFIGNNATSGWKVSNASDIPVYAKGMVIEYIWRLDFAIGANESDDIVEMFEVNPNGDRTKKLLDVQAISAEGSWQFSPDVKRSWRVRDASITNADGHPVSYHLEPVYTGNIYRNVQAHPWSLFDLFVTRDDACELYASGNAGACGTSVDQFTNSESLTGEDVVLWYRSAWRRLPRVEDRDGFKPGWTRFQLIPRDWTATSPLD